MSRTVVRYEGEGKARRAIYADQGPANGRGQSDGASAGMSSIARATDQAASGEHSGGTAATIERRMATEAQRAHWRERPDGPSPIAPITIPGRPAMGSPEHLQASRLRGAVRHVEVLAAARPLIALVPSPVTPEESPVMAIAPPPPPRLPDLSRVTPDGLRAVAAALDEAIAARAAYVVAGESLAAAERAVELAWASVRGGTATAPDPIEDEPVNVAERRHEQLLNGDGAANFDAAVQRAFEGSGVEVRTSFTPTDDVAPAPAPAAGGPAPKGETKQSRILGVVLKHGGDLRAIAAEVGTTRDNVNATLHNAGKRGLLTIPMRAVLPGAFSKYTGV